MIIKFKLDGKEVSWDTDKRFLTKGSSNLKLNKSEKHGVYSTMGLHLSPYKTAGYNVCPKASPGCIAACLNCSGQGQYFTEGKKYDCNLHISRTAKTVLLKRNRKLFFQKLKSELNQFVRVCQTRRHTIPAVRLNCTSDVAWEKILDPETGKSIIELFPMIQFYDYTKIYSRLGNVPANYHLTFSRSEINENEALLALERGFNVAVTFKNLPSNYKGYRVIDGDQTDLRFMDNKFFENLSGKGMVVGLKPKGWRIGKDKTGFLIRENGEIEFNLQKVA